MRAVPEAGLLGMRLVLVHSGVLVLVVLSLYMLVPAVLVFVL